MSAGAPRGQIIVIFAFLLTILLGMAAFVVDLAWIWSNQLQVQRAADAGALAGVVHLPGDPLGGISAAKAESRKNGFEDLVDGVVIVANPDPEFDRRMIVNVSAPVDTFFLRRLRLRHRHGQPNRKGRVRASRADGQP